MKKVIYGILALLLVASCDSNDSPGKIDMPEDGVPVRLTLSLPAAGSSRSTTVTPDDETNSSSGFEIGQAGENNINSVLIVIANKVVSGGVDDYTFVAYAQADGTPGNNTGTSLPTFTVRFKSPEIIARAGQEVYVFAYCNPTTDIMGKFENLKAGDSFTDFTMEIEQDASIWVDNNFLMTNRDICSTILPSVNEMEKSDIHNPIDLGTAKVQRVSARFDFEQTTVAGQNAPNLYPITSSYDETVIEGYVELVGISLFNMSKTFNYLPMMSANSSWSNPQICVRETSNNWVVSTGYDIKANYAGGNASSIFYFPTSIPDFAPSSADYTPFDALVNDDNDENWTPGANTSYKIWRYATENTIPGVTEQKHGISTGVLFKGYIRGEAGSDLNNMLKSGKVLYAFDGHIYGDKDALTAFVEGAPTTTLADFYKQLFVPDNLDANGDLINTVKDGITIYRPVVVNAENVYPCYYYYYNRHDDNMDNITMGDMEFAVVRNNVYKLKVNSISEFGHPGEPGDDPDPEDPDGPDESPKTYFKLSVQTLPWVVRVNAIDF